jgi:hypothetical protein
VLIKEAYCTYLNAYVSIFFISQRKKFQARLTSIHSNKHDRNGHDFGWSIILEVGSPDSIVIIASNAPGLARLYFCEGFGDIAHAAAVHVGNVIFRRFVGHLHTFRHGTRFAENEFGFRGVNGGRVAEVAHSGIDFDCHAAIMQMSIITS